MESRIFIREATALISHIKALSPTERNERREAIQKEINSLFQGLGNPTLMTAVELMEVSQEYGFNVNPQVTHRLTQAEAIWSM